METYNTTSLVNALLAAAAALAPSLVIQASSSLSSYHGDLLTRPYLMLCLYP